MIEREKPNLVAICPRTLDQRLAMFRAAAEAGAHILLEKPFASSLEEADAMVELAERHRIKVQVGHTARPTPVTLRALKMVRGGAIGTLLEMRGRGKEDRRAGGEDMMVLGTHVFDLMRLFAGDPKWVFGHVMHQGAEVGRRHTRQATEPLGAVAGDDIAAMFLFESGARGHFGSKASDVLSGERFGLGLYGSKGAIFLPLTTVPSAPPDMLRSNSWSTGQWEKIDHAEDRMSDRHQANQIMVRDLLRAIETGGEPVCNARDGRWTIEMVMGVYASHQVGARVKFPLKDRRHPLG
jgi:predicted dehydrogenase